MVDGNYDETVRERALSRQYRVEADRANLAVGERYTAPLLDAIACDAPSDTLPKPLLAYWLEEARETKAFDPLRGRPDFEELIQQLTKPPIRKSLTRLSG